jgi:hypothetical protein
LRKVQKGFLGSKSHNFHSYSSKKFGIFKEIIRGFFH